MPGNRRKERETRVYINTNSGAQQAAGYLQTTNAAMNVTLASMSSGYKITSASQNPAGLAISEQMQSQINGMSQAYQNANQGISMLQTADGALSQIQNILQSMYSLATQAANGTNVGVDRGSLQSQMDQYTKEINSITNQTAFNTKNLLDGVLGNVNLAIGANPNQALAFSLAAVDAVSLGVAGTNPVSAAFSNATATTDAGQVGLTSLGIFNGSSSTNPYGSYGLTGTNYGIQAVSANLATADINGTGALATGALSASTTTENAAGTFNAGATTGLTGVAGKMSLAALSYTGSAPQNVQVRLTNSQTWSGATPSMTGEQFQVQFSTNGGSTWQTAYTNGSATSVGAGPSGDVVLQGTGLTINFGASTAPTFASISGTSTTTGTATQTDNYTIQLQPAQAQFQLVNSSGAPIGTATTIYGRAAGTQQVAIGDANSGQAVSANFQASSLYASTNTFNSTSGALTATPGLTALPSTLNFTITDGTNQTAVGSGGTVTQKAVVSGGLSVMNYSAATNAQTAITAALTQVSAQRAQVGSLMDRLQQAGNDLQASKGNLTSAQAGIMDTNMGTASAQLAQQQVLEQAGVAMLATANQIPAMLLKLLP